MHGQTAYLAVTRTRLAEAHHNTVTRLPGTLTSSDDFRPNDPKNSHCSFMAVGNSPDCYDAVTLIERVHDPATVIFLIFLR